MPECKFGLNDKLIMDKDGQGTVTKGGKKIAGVEVLFHQFLPYDDLI